MSGTLVRSVALWAAIALASGYVVPPHSDTSTRYSSRAPAHSAADSKPNTEYVLNHDAAERYWAARIAAGFPFDEMPQHESPIDKKEDTVTGYVSSSEPDDAGYTSTEETEVEVETTTTAAYQEPAEEVSVPAVNEDIAGGKVYGAPVDVQEVEKSEPEAEIAEDASASTTSYVAPIEEVIESTTPTMDESATAEEKSYEAPTEAVESASSVPEVIEDSYNSATTAETEAATDSPATYEAPADAESTTVEPPTETSVEEGKSYGAAAEKAIESDSSETKVTEKSYPATTTTEESDLETEASAEESVAVYGAPAEDVVVPELEETVREENSYAAPASTEENSEASGYGSPTEEEGSAADEEEETSDAEIESVLEEHHESGYGVPTESSGLEIIDAESEPEFTYHAAAYTDNRGHEQEQEIIYAEPSTEAPTTTVVYAEPSTEAPTTTTFAYSEPSSEAPTTTVVYAEPSTEAPTTTTFAYSEPSTEAPTTTTFAYSEPSSEAPTTTVVYAEPSTEAPTTTVVYAEPSTEAPTTTTVAYAEASTDAPQTTVVYTESAPTSTMKVHKKPAYGAKRYWKKISASTTTTTTAAVPVSSEEIIVDEPSHEEPAAEAYYTAKKIAEDGASRYWKKIHATTEATTTEAATTTTTTTVAPVASPVETVMEKISYVAESLPSFSEAVDGLYGAVEQLEKDAEEFLTGTDEPVTIATITTTTHAPYILNADAAAAFWATARIPTSTAAPVKESDGEKIPTIEVPAEDTPTNTYGAPAMHNSPAQKVRFHPKKQTLTKAKMNGY